MGLITDRTQEHLGVSDGHVIELRRYLLDAIQQMQEGKDPPGIFRDPEMNKIGNFVHMVTAAVKKGEEYRDLLPKL